jgi:hypothetical protein
MSKPLIAVAAKRDALTLRLAALAAVAATLPAPLLLAPQQAFAGPNHTQVPQPPMPHQQPQMPMPQLPQIPVQHAPQQEPAPIHSAP